MFRPRRGLALRLRAELLVLNLDLFEMKDLVPAFIPTEFKERSGIPREVVRTREMRETYSFA